MADNGVPGHLGCVVSSDGTPVGTCFQVAPGVVVTAWQVLDELGVGGVDAAVRVDGFAAGSSGLTGRVLRVDPLHDLAIVQVDVPLAATVPGLFPSDNVNPETDIEIFGLSPADGEICQYAAAVGQWIGPAMRDNEVPLGALTSRLIASGMSGGPVYRVADNMVLGVVSGRYNLADNWNPDMVSVGRTEDLATLLIGITETKLADSLPTAAADLVLTFSDADVRLTGTGIDVLAPHRGIGEGLRAAIDDTRRARSRRPVQREGTEQELEPVSAIVRRAGELLADSFLPEPVAHALRDVLTQAELDEVPVRLGVTAPGWPGLPWEALSLGPGGGPLALHRLVTLYRRHAGELRKPEPGPLRVVVAIAAPENGEALLDYESELRKVHSAVRAARQRDAEVEVVQFATTSAIRQALAERTAHVLHLSGHGSPGILVLEGEDGSPRPVSAEELIREAIPPDGMPAVIALAACHTDAPGENCAQSFAAQLVTQGANAVIATEISVTDKYATRVFARVYEELAHVGHDVIVSLANARRLVQSELNTSIDSWEQDLGSLEEWSVVSILARAGSVPVCSSETSHGMKSEVRVSARTVTGLSERKVGEFVGRRSAQRALPSILCEPDATGVVLHGVGGIGKTALAQQLIHRVAEREPDRVVVAQTGVLSIDGILTSIAEAIRRNRNLNDQLLTALESVGHINEGWQTRLADLRSTVLDDVPLLVVLDNFEDNLTSPTGRSELRDDALADFLGRLITDPGHCSLLITSRFTFKLSDDADHRLHLQPVGPLSLAETLKLIWALPQLDKLDTAQVDQIQVLVGGHPRSLEYLDALLSGGHARFTDVVQRLTAKIEARFGVSQARKMLTGTSGLDQAIAATITLAADDVLLPELLKSTEAVPGAIRLLIGLSVHRVPVDRNAALFQIGEVDVSSMSVLSSSQIASIAGGFVDGYSITMDGSDRPGASRSQDQADQVPHVAIRETVPVPPLPVGVDLDQILDALVGSTLVTVDQESGTAFVHRWTATELPRHLTNKQHVTAFADAHLRAAAYWLWRVTFGPGGRGDVLPDLKEARYHLLQAGELDVALRISDDLVLGFGEIGARDAEAELVHDTLRYIPSNSPRRSRWLFHLGRIAYDRGDHAEAKRQYEQAVLIDRKNGNLQGVSGANHHLGILAQSQGNYRESKQHYNQAHKISKKLGDHVAAARTRMQLGGLAELQDNYREALEHCQEAIQVFERCGDDSGLADGYFKLGSIMHRKGDLSAAEPHYRKSLKIDEENSKLSGVASTYYQLGILAHQLGKSKYERAEHYWISSLEIYEQLSDLRGIAGNYHQLGMLASHREDFVEANRRYMQALAIHERLGAQAGQAATYGELGRLAFNEDNFDQAEGHFQKALAINTKLGNRREIDISMGDLATVRKKWILPPLLSIVTVGEMGLTDDPFTQVLLEARLRIGHAEFDAVARQVPGVDLPMLHTILDLAESLQE